MVLPVGVALVHLDGGQRFQDRGAEVKQGGGAVVGGVLQGQRGGARRGCEGSGGSAGPVHVPILTRPGFSPPYPPTPPPLPPVPSSQTV